MKRTKNKYFKAKEYAEYIEMKTKIGVLKRLFPQKIVLDQNEFNAIMGSDLYDKKAK